jgi:hypothetical protein
MYINIKIYRHMRAQMHPYSKAIRLSSLIGFLVPNISAMRWQLRRHLDPMIPVMESWNLAGAVDTG